MENHKIPWFQTTNQEVFGVWFDPLGPLGSLATLNNQRVLQLATFDTGPDRRPLCSEALELGLRPSWPEDLGRCQKHGWSRLNHWKWKGHTHTYIYFYTYNETHTHIYIYVFICLKNTRTNMNQECDLEMCLKIGKLHQLAAFIEWENWW